jgi:hypothetical protein
MIGFLFRGDVKLEFLLIHLAACPPALPPVPADVRSPPLPYRDYYASMQTG